jgi:hypothetical protein
MLFAFIMVIVIFFVFKVATAKGPVGITVNPHPVKPSPLNIHCPTCGSTDVSLISSVSKVGSVLAFGVFSIGKLSKSYQCHTCKYKW